MKTLTITYFLKNEKIIQRIQKDFLYSIGIIENILDTEFDNLILITADTKVRYDKLLKTNRPPWGVTTQKNGVIYIYNPLLWKKSITGHTTNDLVPSLIHELVHVYFFQNKLKCPIWFEEGLAVKLSDENKGNKRKAFYQLVTKYPIPNVIEATSNFKKMSGKLPLMHYLTFFMFISYLFDLFGTIKIINFLRGLKVNNDFEPFFDKEFNRSLSETWTKFRKELENSL